MSSGPFQPQTREHRFEGRAIQLPADLTDAQLDGRACIRCGAEDRPMRPVEAWSEHSAALFECVGAEPCIDNADVWHTAH